MMYIDSWIWIEFFSDENCYKKAEEVIEALSDDPGIISTVVLMEVKYRIKRKFGRELADRVIHIVESIDNLTVLPVTSKVAKYSADLRDKYYKRNTRELSYADAIHLATALLARCDILYTGDPDFEDIDEIVTYVIS